MRFRFFQVPLQGGREADELNRLLAKERVAEIHKELVKQGDAHYWAFLVQLPIAEDESPPVASRKSKVDYREVLSADDFALFAALHECRKKLSTAAGAAVYAVATNEQLAEMVRRRVKSRKALLEIPRFGEARAAKYGDALIASLSAAEATSGDQAAEA